MKLNFFLTILFSIFFLSLFSTETPFDWQRNLDKSDGVAQVKIMEVQGEKVTAMVAQSFSPEIGSGKKITFVNNDSSTNFSLNNDYFVFLKNGKKKNQYILPASANLPVSGSVVMCNFSSGEEPYKYTVSDLSEFLNVYYHTELRSDYCDKLFRVIEHSSSTQLISDKTKEIISQYLILKPEKSGKIKDILREDFLQFINSLKDIRYKSYGESVLSRGIQYMNVMKDLGIWNLEPYFYDFMREFNGLSFRFRENPELFQIKKAKEDSLWALINGAKPDFLPVGQWTVWVWLDDDLSMKYYMAEFYYDEVEGISEHLIFMLADYMKEHFGCDIGVYPKKDYPLFTSGSCVGNQLLGHFINYLVPHAGSQDITFLLNLQRYGYVRTVGDIDCLEKLIQAAKEVESKTVMKSRR